MFVKHPNMRSNNLVALGYWRQKVSEKSDLPYPTEYIDETLDDGLKNILASYIQRSPAIEHWKGYSDCRICGEHLGSDCLSDGKYVFPEKFDHYITAHNVKPPNEFILHVLTDIK